MEMLIFLFPEVTSKWFADRDITVFDWPTSMPELNPIWNLWDFQEKDEKQSIQQYRRAEGSLVPR